MRCEDAARERRPDFDRLNLMRSRYAFSIARRIEPVEGLERPIEHVRIEWLQTIILEVDVEDSVPLDTRVNEALHFLE